MRSASLLAAVVLVGAVIGITGAACSQRTSADADQDALNTASTTMAAFDASQKVVATGLDTAIGHIAVAEATAGSAARAVIDREVLPMLDDLIAKADVALPAANAYLARVPDRETSASIAKLERRMAAYREIRDDFAGMSRRLGAGSADAGDVTSLLMKVGLLMSVANSGAGP